MSHLTHTEGYSSGYEEGRRVGGCKAILESFTVTPQMSDLRVLYIPQGFPAIDTGVIDALRQSVRECTVGNIKTILADAIVSRPDLVLVMNGLHGLPEDHEEQLRQVRAFGIRTAVWFVDDPYFTEKTAKNCLYYDVVFTHEMSCVPFYQSMQAKQVHYMPLGVGPSVFHPRKVNPEYKYDICFIGSAFWNRVALFDQLAPFLEGKKVLIVGGSWERMQRQDILGPFIRPGWMDIEETANYYNGAKIVLNIHRPAESGLDNENLHQIPAQSINPRTYEISACGTLQMTDIRDDLFRYYQPGHDIETFATPEELQAKLAYYLEHETERLRLAWEGMRTTLQKHTFAHRIPQLLQLAVT